MSVQFSKLKKSGRIIHRAFCEVCGAPASFGSGVDMQSAIKLIVDGHRAAAMRAAGKWYCHEHYQDIQAPLKKAAGDLF